MLSKFQKGLLIGAGVVIVPIVIFAVFMISFSSEALDVTEFALKYSSASKKIDETQLYEGGKRHWIGPFSSLKKFKNELQEVYFDNDEVLSSRSNVASYFATLNCQRGVTGFPSHPIFCS